MDRKSAVVVRIKHGDNEVEFEGGVDDVWTAVNKYFSQTLGPIQIISRLTGEADLTELAHGLADKVVITKEGIDVVQQGDAKKRIVLCLAAAYAGKRLGIFVEEALTPKKVAGYIRMDERVVRARLSELWKEGLVDRDAEGRYIFKPSMAMKMLK
ncbi:MAG: hypothetical protein QXQ70_04430 [Candidatus Caldarchaeum sp.]